MPGACQKARSAPQKQPMPKTACWCPSGNGGLSDVPSTSWRSGTISGCERPGSARSGAIIVDFSRKRNMPSMLLRGTTRKPAPVRLARAGASGLTRPSAEYQRQGRLFMYRRTLAALVAAAATLVCAAPAFGVVGQPRTGSAKYDRDASVVQYGGTTYLFFARSQQTCNRLTTPIPALCPDNLDYDLYYKLSSDGGKTFGPATLLDTNPGPVFFRGRTVAATANADGVHVLWSNGANSIDGSVYHYFAPGGTAAFTARQEVADITNDVFNAEAVGDGANLFVYAQENSQINAYRFAT